MCTVKRVEQQVEEMSPLRTKVPVHEISLKYILLQNDLVEGTKDMKTNEIASHSNTASNTDIGTPSSKPRYSKQHQKALSGEY